MTEQAKTRRMLPGTKANRAMGEHDESEHCVIYNCVPVPDMISIRIRPGRAAQLGFAELRMKNIVRCETAFNHIIETWTPNDWMTAAAGELGEAANMLKKERRGDFKLDDPFNDDGTVDYREAIGWELADVVIYLDLLAARLGIDLGEAVRAKFNIVSQRRGSDIRL